MEKEQKNLSAEELQQKAYQQFFDAAQKLLEVTLAQLPPQQGIAIMGAVHAGHSELEIFTRFGTPSGATTGDALIALRTGDKLLGLAQIEARPGQPPNMKLSPSVQ